MELIKLTEEVYSVSKRLERATVALYDLADDKAASERDYRRELMKEMLVLRSGGMPATLIGDVAKGNVADLLFNRDAAEAKFKSAIESLDALKSQLSALQSILRYQESIG